MIARPPCLSSETEFKSLPLRFSCMNIARSKANQLEKCLLNVYEFFYERSKSRKKLCLPVSRALA